MTTDFFDAAESVAFQASTIFSFDEIYVVRGLDSELPVNENGYLVMINSGGDRVAFKAPGAGWVIDDKIIKGYKEMASNYEHAIRVYPDIEPNI